MLRASERCPVPRRKTEIIAVPGGGRLPGPTSGDQSDPEHVSSERCPYYISFYLCFPMWPSSAVAARLVPSQNTSGQLCADSKSD